MSYTILNKDLDVCGVLDLNGKGCKFYNDLRTTKVADEQGKIWSDTVEISVPYGYNETDYISQGNHLLKEGSDGYHYCYRIYNWIDGVAGSTHIKRAMGINLFAWDMNHKIIPANVFPLANSQEVFEYLVRGTGWEINKNEYVGDSKRVEITAGQNGMYWMDQQIANFNVEIRAFVEVYNGRIIRKLLDIVTELGDEKGYRLEYGHNILGVARSGDDSQLYTKLFVYGGNDANNNPVTIKSVNSNRDYIVDDDANDEYNNGGEYLEGYVSNPDITNPGALLAWGKEQLKKLNHPKYTYAVDVAYLGFMPNLGDHFRVVDFSMMPELSVSARVIQLDESEANPLNNRVTIGEFVDIIVVTPKDVINLQNSAEKAADELREKIASKNTFYRQDTEPTDADEGDFWIYTGTDYTIPPIQRLENGEWVAVQEMVGATGEAGQPGADGKTTYLHIAYADLATGSGFSQSPDGKAYMGTYVDYTEADSTDPSKYTWVKIQGPQGPQGPQGLQGIQGPQGTQGIQGPTGADGKTQYTHIAYATNATGTTGFSTSDSEGAIYIGMYVDFTQTDSTDPSKYNWTLIKGADGAQGTAGPKGADGQTPYLHIAYANDSTGSTGFSITDSTDKIYIGTYTDFSQNDSTDPTKYRWTKIQGPRGEQGAQGLQGLQGPKGDQGLAGPAGTSSYTHIAYANNFNGTQGFSVSDSAGKSYIGMYVDNTSTDSTDPTKYKWTLFKGSDGAQGVQGPAGEDGQTPYLHIAYSNSDDGSVDFSIVDPTDKAYIGTYTDYTPADSEVPSDYTWVRVQGPEGPQGPQGLQGLQGIQGPTGASSYTHIAYAANGTGTSGFSLTDTNGKTHMGMYVSNSSTPSTDPTLYKWSLIKGANGAQGIQGPAGSDGLTPYLHIAYANNSNGTSGFSITDPTGRSYIGVYTDFVQNDSTDPTKYKWTLFKGEQGPTGLQGLQGPQGDQGIPGPAGTSTYTHIAYATNSTGTAGFSLSDSQNAVYIGMYVDSSPTDSTDPTKYKWSMIKGAPGEQGVPGTPGVNGQTPYLHIAYATNATGTTGFSTTDSLGKTYIGVYTDFSQNDSTDATKYSWSLIQGPQGPQGPAGDNAIIGVLSNESHTLPANSSGTVSTFAGAVTTMSIYEGATDMSSSWTVTATPDTGVTGSLSGKTYTVTALTTDTGFVDLTATKSGYASITKRFVLTKAKQGATGTNATSYWLVTSASALSLSINNLFTPTNVTITAKSQTGTATPINYAGRFIIAESTDGTTFTTVYTSAANEATKTHTPTSSSVKAIRVQMYLAGGTTTLLDEQIIPVVKDGATGAQGPKGDQGVQGVQGIQGPAGANGVTQYLHIRYANNAAGTSFTSTPQSDTTHIGLAVTTSSTGPTANTGYTWSNYKGPQGSQGIQGPAGANGQPTYTWVKYADSATGSGMSDTPSGKQYIGMAFNKTTATESSVASDYAWSPLFDNVIVGGRNLLFGTGNMQGNTSTTRTESTDEFLNLMVTTAVYNTTAGTTPAYADAFAGESTIILNSDEYIVSFYAKSTVAQNIKCYFHTPNNTTSAVSSTGQTSTAVDGAIDVSITTGWKKYWVKWKHPGASTTTTKQVIIGRNTATSTVSIAAVKLETGNVATEWAPAPEDYQADLNSKANDEDLKAYATILADVSAEVNLKAGMDAFEALREAFEARVETDIMEKEQLLQDLMTLEGRTALVETIAGENKLVTQFIETVIMESEEGIFIGNETDQTGILISTDRISFLDSNVEVAYISNQTMQISHGIFVESATISGFKFERLPGTEILVITWVGG